jgi:plasmid rolling circle replication initiator protein Rep
MPPYLDNIETSDTHDFFCNPLHINAFGASDSENVYSGDDLLKALSDIEDCKKRTIDTAVSLIDFGNDFDWQERGWAMYHCGENIAFEGSRVVSANFCRLRLCPMCQRRKSLKTYSDFCKVLSVLKDYSFLHLVLTVPNCDGSELRDILDYMNRCSSRFFRIKEISRAFVGVARVTEISYNNKKNNFHPHFHNLIAVKKSYFNSRNYLKYDRLRELWSCVWKNRKKNLSRLKDDEFSVSDLSDSEKLQIYITKADKGALPEIAKYAVKPLMLDCSRKERAAILQSLFEATYGKRLIQTYGVIREACKIAKVDLNADCVELDTLENKAVVTYNYNYYRSRYEKGETI